MKEKIIPEYHTIIHTEDDLINGSAIYWQITSQHERPINHRDLTRLYRDQIHMTRPPPQSYVLNSDDMIIHYRIGYEPYLLQSKLSKNYCYSIGLIDEYDK